MWSGWRGGLFGLVVAVAVLATGCSSGGGQSTQSGGQAATATTLVPLAQPSSRCGAPEVKATVLRFPAPDGTQLDGVLVGFWPYAIYLSKRGLQALAIDLRCYGESACPQADDAKSRVVDDVAGAVAALRAHGAKRVALVGASLGASTALLAGVALRPPVAAVVNLSTGKFDLSTILGGPMPLDTYSAARRLTVPVLFAVARDDPNVPVEQVQALYRMAPAGTSSWRSWAAPRPASTAGTSLAMATELALRPSLPRSPASSAPTRAASGVSGNLAPVFRDSDG
jgi:hypothetical protein